MHHHAEDRQGGAQQRDIREAKGIAEEINVEDGEKAHKELGEVVDRNSAA